MKKVLTLILVLGMASAASAALQISVHPTTQDLTWDPMNPAPTDITINVSDELILDIYTDSVITAGMPGDGEWFLMCDVNKGTISGGTPDATLLGMGNSLSIYDTKAASNWDIADPQDGVGGYIWPAYIPMNNTIYDGILFHCEGEGDAVVTLVSGVSVVPTEGDPYVEVTGTWDEVVIHQIPEPMTMALLGLGGLALIRRRK